MIPFTDTIREYIYTKLTNLSLIRVRKIRSIDGDNLIISSGTGAILEFRSDKRVYLNGKELKTIGRILNGDFSTGDTSEWTVKTGEGGSVTVVSNQCRLSVTGTYPYVPHYAAIQQACNYIDATKLDFDYTLVTGTTVVSDEGLFVYADDHSQGTLIW